MQDSKRAPRRRHTADVKSRVLRECAEPGNSVARVAMAHGVNANLVHKWRRQVACGELAVVPMREPGAFIPLRLASAPGPVAGDIRIELRRGPVAVEVTWPVASAAHCAAWMREVLK